MRRTTDEHISNGIEIAESIASRRLNRRTFAKLVPRLRQQYFRRAPCIDALFGLLQHGFKQLRSRAGSYLILRGVIVRPRSRIPASHRGNEIWNAARIENRIPHAGIRTYQIA